MFDKIVLATDLSTDSGTMLLAAPRTSGRWEPLRPCSPMSW